MSTLVIHTDGGSRGNPGPAATGIVYLFDGQTVHEFGRSLGTQTNNEAEYQAVLHSLENLAEFVTKYSPTKIEWKLDSMLVVQQLSRVWKIKEPRLATFAQSIWKQLADLNIPYSFKYVPRAENHLADAMVNSTLDALSS